MLRRWILALTVLSAAMGGGALVFYLTFWPRLMERNTALIAFIVEKALERYHEENEAFPEGSGRDVVAVLLGDNPRSKSYLRPAFAEFLDPDGDVLDSWERPFVFDRLDDGRLKLLSAGRNGRFHDADDLTSDSLN